MNLEPLEADLRVEEGTKRLPNKRHRLYQDTKGKWTIGWGRNLSDRGLSDAEADYLLRNDVLDAVAECTGAFPWFLGLDEVRQRVVSDMAFNLGLPRLLAFKKMIAALAVGNFEMAAEEMLDSQWAEDVKGRAEVLAQRMRTGQE